MRKAVKAIAAASALIVPLAMAPDILAQGLPGIGFNWTGNLAMPRGMMGGVMQGQGMMGRMMQGQGMMGGMVQGESMGQMDQMMEDCSKMMQNVRQGSRGNGNQPEPPAQPERRG